MWQPSVPLGKQLAIPETLPPLHTISWLVYMYEEGCLLDNILYTSSSICIMPIGLGTGGDGLIAFLRQIQFVQQDTIFDKLVKSC